MKSDFSDNPGLITKLFNFGNSNVVSKCVLKNTGITCIQNNTCKDLFEINIRSCRIDEVNDFLDQVQNQKKTKTKYIIIISIFLFIFLLLLLFYIWRKKTSKTKTDSVYDEISIDNNSTFNNSIENGLPSESDTNSVNSLLGDLALCIDNEDILPSYLESNDNNNNSDMESVVLQDIKKANNETIVDAEIIDSVPNYYERLRKRIINQNNNNNNNYNNNIATSTTAASTATNTTNKNYDNNNTNDNDNNILPSYEQVVNDNHNNSYLNTNDYNGDKKRNKLIENSNNESSNRYLINVNNQKNFLNSEIVLRDIQHNNNNNNNNMKQQNDNKIRKNKEKEYTNNTEEMQDK